LKELTGKGPRINLNEPPPTCGPWDYAVGLPGREELYLLRWTMEVLAYCRLTPIVRDK